MGLSVVICIPAFNEDKNIQTVIDASKNYGDVVVFDNNSVDKTAYLALQAGAKVVPVMEQGYDSVIESISIFFRKSEYGKLVIIDGDGEVGLSYIKQSIILLDKYDAVIGVRPSIKRFAEKIVCSLFNTFYGVEDIYCGFKCFTKKGVNPCYVKKTFGTSVFNKGSSAYNQQVILSTRGDNSRLGDGFYLNYKLFIGGMRGLIL
jgi:glycosyltransferase involved in cell wall biosynthesis